MGLILLIILILLVIGALPVYPHSANWGPGPALSLWIILLVVLVLILFGYVPRGF
jgi:hypothetical protein